MAQQIQWKKLIGQAKAKETLSHAFGNKLLGHAYLFCGPEGVGKFQAAVELSLALHCDTEDAAPCYQCESCRKLLQYSDPDFHCVFPVALESSHKKPSDSAELTEEGWLHVAEQTRSRLQNPYQITGTKLLHIPVDWIRELNESVMRGSIGSKTSIAVICDVDLMQAASANAMLKTLEEPPPNTLMILLTRNLHGVLPTIRSRCQILRFGTLSRKELSSALAQRYSFQEDDPRLSQILACAGGSYGIAQSLIDESLDTFFEQAAGLWKLCAGDTPLDVFSLTVERIIAETCGHGQDYAGAEKLLRAFLQIQRAIFFHNMSPTENYFIGMIRSSVPVPQIAVDTTELLLAESEKALQAIQARGNISLVIITFCMNMVELLHGQKY